MVACRRSGLIRTSGTVITCLWITGSCTSPRDRTSASACRTSSPARNWRWDWPRDPAGFEKSRISVSPAVQPGLGPGRTGDRLFLLGRRLGRLVGFEFGQNRAGSSLHSLLDPIIQSTANKFHQYPDLTSLLID